MNKTRERIKKAAAQAPAGYQNERLRFAARHTEEEVLRYFSTSREGLSEDAAEESRDEYGENKVTKHKKKSLIRKIAEAFINPFTLILIALAVVSAITDIIVPLRSGEEAAPVTVIIILVMVISSGILRFVQEARSDNAADRLLDMITTTATVDRAEGQRMEIPIEDLAVGDIIHLSAGDMIPADVRILEAKDFFVSQAALTGESESIEKFGAEPADEDQTVTEFSDLAFMGTNVIGGSALAVVVCTGDDTFFGSVAKSVATEPVKTSFEKGVNSVSWVLIRFMLIMVPIVFFITGISLRDWTGALMFAISVAVGLTPEMLPMIVTTSLAKGAVSMSKEKTIVKNLNSMQNLGAMDVLCTDKTGTLTQDKVVLEYHLDVEGKENVRVLRHAFLNSYFQTGLKNLMDKAIIHQTYEEAETDEGLRDITERYRKIDEVPFDFERRRMSVVVTDLNGKIQMITKGAVEEMLTVCSHVEYQGKIQELTQELRGDILKTVDNLNDDGMRVLAIAQKTNPSPVGAFGVADEADMVLIGYLAFLDPPKESTAGAIQALRDYGVTTKVLTGDNDKITRTICKQVGLTVDRLLLGSEIEAMTEQELQKAVEETTVFAKLSPEQKCRIIAALRENGHVVGFMGDGINDAGGMREADVGISVDTAVDIAKESADIILLEKDLMVLEKGIIEGRKIYANMIKYIKMTASSNFGNMFSVVAASALLPFLPMMSLHLILLNLIYDLSCTAIPWDNVDTEYLQVPRKWDASSISKFMIWIGPTSSIFDWITYLILYFVICPQFVSGGMLYSAIPDGTLIQSGLLAGMDMKLAYMGMFQAGWFVESMWTQSLVIHMIRTQKIPFIQSHASASLTLLSFTGIAILTAIPFTPLGKLIGFVALPPVFFAYLGGIVLGYMILVTVIKKAYVRRYGELL